MTEKEKAEEYATEISRCKECRNHNFCHKIENEYLPKCEKWEWLFIGIEKGLAEGRKEEVKNVKELNKEQINRIFEQQKEIENLEKENAKLKRDNKLSEEIIIGEQQEINELKKEIEKLKAQVAKQRCKNAYVVSDKNSAAVLCYTVYSCNNCPRRS